MNTPSSQPHSMDFTPGPSPSPSVAHSQMPSSSHPAGQISELLVPYRGYLWTLAFALMELPVDQREVVILQHLRDRSLQQIADETGRTTASVAGLLRRGLAQLRQILERTDNP